MRFNRKFDAFEDCLYRMLNGASIDQVAETYPNLTNELRPMLQVAKTMHALGKETRVAKDAQARSRARFLSAAIAEQPRPHLKTSPLSFHFPRLALTALIILIALFLGSITTAAVSAKSLPGDPLYPIKLATERTRLLLVNDTAHKIELEQTFDHERLEEVQALIEKTRSTRVTFAGALKEKGESAWMVDDVRVLITPETQLIGDLKPGFYVDVQGILQTDGTVRADQIRAREFQITGPIQKISPEQWIVAGVAIQVSPAVQDHLTPFVGSLVTIHAYLLSNGNLRAFQVDVLAASSGGSTSPAGPAFTDTFSPSETHEADHETKPTEVEDHQISPEPGKTEGYSGEEQPTETDDHFTQPEPTEEHEPQVSKSPEPTEVHEPETQKSPESTEDEHRLPKTPKPGDDHHDGEHDSHPTDTPPAMTAPSSTPEPVSSIEPTEDGHQNENGTPEATREHDD